MEYNHHVLVPRLSQTIHLCQPQKPLLCKVICHSIRKHGWENSGEASLCMSMAIHYLLCFQTLFINTENVRDNSIHFLDQLTVWTHISSALQSSTFYIKQITWVFFMSSLGVFTILIIGIQIQNHKSHHFAIAYWVIKLNQHCFTFPNMVLTNEDGLRLSGRASTSHTEKVPGSITSISS